MGPLIDIEDSCSDSSPSASFQSGSESDGESDDACLVNMRLRFLKTSSKGNIRSASKMATKAATRHHRTQRTMNRQKGSKTSGNSAATKSGANY